MGGAERRRRRATNPENVARLKAKINDSSYLDAAIDRIAMFLSNQLVDVPQSGNNDIERRLSQLDKFSVRVAH